MNHSFLKPSVFVKYKIRSKDGGVEAVDFDYEPQEMKRNFDQGTHWIWLDPGKFGRYQKSFYTTFCDCRDCSYAVARFRKKVNLAESIEKITVRVSADVKYRLFINERKAGRGPAPAGGDYANREPPEWWYYDEYDFTGLIKKGKNIICSEVCLLPSVQSDYSMGHGGFFFEAEVTYKNGEKRIISSDGSWRAELSKANLSPCCYDASQNDGDWTSLDYDDSNWSRCGIVNSRWNLMPAELPGLMETRVRPVRVFSPFEEFRGRLVNSGTLVTGKKSAFLRPGVPFTFWLDFGKIYSGTVFLSICADRGTKFTLEAQEVVGKTEAKEPAEIYVTGDGPQRYEGFELRSAQYLKITVANLTTTVEIREIAFNLISYPVSYKGDFACSDNLLNHVYRAGRWTNQICMQRYHMDSPLHQEALGCTGDYVIQSLINYVTFGDNWLTRRDILRTASYIRQKHGYMFHTSYSLLWIQMLMDYYQYTGDFSLFQKLAPVVSLLLRRFKSYVGKSGLIETPPSFMFIDWVQVGKYNMHHPPRRMGQGALTAFYCGALDRAVRFFSLIRAREESASCEELSKRTKEAFNRCLWDEKRGLYRDGIPCKSPIEVSRWMPEDCNEVSYSQHTNTLAVLYDIAPIYDQKQIMRNVLEDDSLIQAQPYFMHFVLEAVSHCGLFEQYGLEQIRRWKRLLDEKEGSLKEVWSGFDCDYSHAWSGTPTYQLPSKVLGIFPAEPGFRTIGIRPSLGDLQWARGNVPTPWGRIAAEYERKEDSCLAHLSIPKGCKAWLQIPREGIGESALLDGKKIPVRSMRVMRECPLGDLIQLELFPGKHDLKLLDRRFVSK